MSQKKQRFLKIILPLLVLVAGAAGAFWLIRSAPDAQKAPGQRPGLLVNTITVERGEHRLQVRSQGSVIAARQIQLQARVAGKVLTVHPDLAPGGIVNKGERLLQIDPSDYQLALQASRSQLQEAQAQLSLELGRQQVAEEEWALFEQQFDAPAGQSDLALREPQLESARARVERAKADLQQAQLQLERTHISAPFHALVVEENVDQGQQVQPQQSLATLVGAEQFWVRVAVPPDQVHVIDIPDENGDGGAAAEVVLDIGNRQRRYQGRVLRMEGSLDARSRMVQLIVAIDNPLGELQDTDADFPLLLNAYVEVIIAGEQTVEAIAVPREALRNGNEVYTYVDGELRMRKVEQVWQREQDVLVSAGLQPGAQVVTSNIAAPVEGMRLRLSSDDNGRQTGAAGDAVNE